MSSSDMRALRVNPFQLGRAYSNAPERSGDATGINDDRFRPDRDLGRAQHALRDAGIPHGTIVACAYLDRFGHSLPHLSGDDARSPSPRSRSRQTLHCGGAEAPQCTFNELAPVRTDSIFTEMKESSALPPAGPEDVLKNSKGDFPWGQSQCTWKGQVSNAVR